MILGAPAVAFWEFKAALFGVAALFCQTWMIEGIIVYSIDKGHKILIVSEENGQNAQQILQELRRGAAFLDAQGVYQGKKSKFCCVIRV